MTPRRRQTSLLLLLATAACTQQVTSAAPRVPPATPPGAVTAASASPPPAQLGPAGPGHLTGTPAPGSAARIPAGGARVMIGRACVLGADAAQFRWSREGLDRYDQQGRQLRSSAAMTAQQSQHDPGWSSLAADWLELADIRDTARLEYSLVVDGRATAAEVHSLQQLSHVAQLTARRIQQKCHAAS